MTFAPDPLDQELAADERRDRDEHAARGRGARLYTIAEAICSELVAVGHLPSSRYAPARVAVFTVLAEHLYGGATSIVLPAALGRIT